MGRPWRSLRSGPLFCAPPVETTQIRRRWASFIRDRSCQAERCDRRERVLIWGAEWNRNPSSGLLEPSGYAVSVKVSPLLLSNSLGLRSKGWSSWRTPLLRTNPICASENNNSIKSSDGVQGLDSALLTTYPQGMHSGIQKRTITEIEISSVGPKSGPESGGWMSVIVPGWRRRRAPTRVIHNSVHTAWTDSLTELLPGDGPVRLCMGRGIA